MGNQIKVLVVEDEIIVSEEIAELLRSFGYEVVAQAQSAEEAMEHISQTPPDVALLDIHIKGEMDGVELAKLIRNNADCAIIFLTAYSDKSTIDRVKEVHPEAYLVKPFEKNGLLAAIDLAFSNYEHTNEEELLKESKAMESLFLKDQHRYEKVLISDILYFEANVKN